MKKIINKGFTLIELLVVIAILGIIMAAVVAGIDPIDKIRAANDAKVQADIGAIGTAMEAYATMNGSYAINQPALIANGDLKVTLTPPTGYVGYTLNCGVAPCANQIIGASLKSKRYSATPFWVWCSSNGKAGASTGIAVCPP